MPNWCENSAIFEHEDPTMIDRVCQGFQSGGLFAEFMPCPAELHEHSAPMRDDKLADTFLEKYGARDWYDWQLKNWGCKWDVESNGDGIQRLSPNTVKVYFDSPWSPPIEGYKSLCAMDFVIEALYNEPGMAYCGKFTGARGGVRDDYMDYGSETAETVRNEIGEELDDFFGISENMADMEEWEKEENSNE